LFDKVEFVSAEDASTLDNCDTGVFFEEPVARVISLCRLEIANSLRSYLNATGSDRTMFRSGTGGPGGDVIAPSCV
jgi:hypothetical protein